MHRTLIVLLYAACHGTPSGPPQPYVEHEGAGSGATADEIVVGFTSLRNDTGMVRCSLYDDGDAFPEGQAHVIARAVARPSAHACVFRGVARAHDYAVVLHHDENNDAIFQKNALGIPAEGYGFSNNAKPMLSAPSFDACKFHFAEGDLALQIAMRY